MSETEEQEEADIFGREGRLREAERQRDKVTERQRNGEEIYGLLSSTSVSAASAMLSFSLYGEKINKGKLFKEMSHKPMILAPSINRNGPICDLVTGFTTHGPLVALFPYHLV